MVSILLSTYNGEKYIGDQLISLINQTHKNINILIRDDCSDDSTPAILECYRKRYSNIKIYDNQNIRMGAAQSFLWLLKNVEDDYYMFCDQDDVWFDSKVKISIDAIKSVERKFLQKEILVHTDLIVTDMYLNVISSSFWDYQGILVQQYGRKYLPFKNYITGCTMIFNRYARNLAIKGSNYAVMHDFWVAISVDSVGGEIISLPIPTLYYRQHQNNAIGAHNKPKFANRLFMFLRFPNFTRSYNNFIMYKYRYNFSIFTYLLKRIKFILKFGR